MLIPSDTPFTLASLGVTSGSAISRGIGAVNVKGSAKPGSEIVAADGGDERWPSNNLALPAVSFARMRLVLKSVAIFWETFSVNHLPFSCSPLSFSSGKSELRGQGDTNVHSLWKGL